MNRQIFIAPFLFISTHQVLAEVSTEYPRGCPDKLRLYLKMDESDRKLFNPINITVKEVVEIKHGKDFTDPFGRSFEYKEIDTIGHVSINDPKGNLPEIIEIKIKKMDHCPFISKILVTSSPPGFSYGVPFWGESYTPFLQASSVLVRFLGTRF